MIISELKTSIQLTLNIYNSIRDLHIFNNTTLIISKLNNSIQLILNDLQLNTNYHDIKQRNTDNFRGFNNSIQLILKIYNSILIFTYSTTANTDNSEQRQLNSTYLKDLQLNTNFQILNNAILIISELKTSIQTHLKYLQLNT